MSSNAELRGGGGGWGGGGQSSLTEYNGVTEKIGSIVYVVLKTPEDKSDTC